MRHGKGLLRMAAGFAVLGIVLFVAGFCLGGRPTNIRIFWEHGGPRVEYRESGWDGSDTVAAASSAPVDRAEDSVAYIEEPDDVPSSGFATEQADATDRETAINANYELPDGTVNLQELIINAAGDEVYIEIGDDWNIYDEQGNFYTSKVTNHKWKIESTKKRTAGQRTQLIVTVPKDFYWEKISLTLGAGELTADGLLCGKMDMEVGAGEVELHHFTCLTESSWEVGAGSILVDGGQIAGETDIECAMGSVELNILRPESYGYSIECAMGSVEVDGESHSGLAVSREKDRKDSVETFYDIECGMGSVTVSFTD